MFDEEDMFRGWDGCWWFIISIGRFLRFCTKEDKKVQVKDLESGKVRNYDGGSG